MLSTVTTEPIAFLQKDFRHHLEQFYTFLNLTPPYHSVEQAIRHLAIDLKTRMQTEQQRMVEDRNLRLDFYGQVFIQSGLIKKHQGIIQSLAKSPQFAERAKEHWHFLKLFST